MANADSVIANTNGGQYTVSAASATGAALYTGAGRLCQIIVTTSGTGLVTIYDSIVSASGTVIFAGPAAGIGLASLPINVQMPFALGLYCIGGTLSPVLTVSYNKSGVNGN